MHEAKPSFEHFPVLLQPLIDLLAPKPGETVVDCTCGLAGHALAIAEGLRGQGQLIAMDLDPACLRTASERLDKIAVRTDLVRANFAEIDHVLAEFGLDKADVILADLGVCSSQLDDPARGFSFQADGPLDMRIDPDLKTTAADLVNGLPERRLAEIISRYSNERHSRKIAKQICRARRAGRITMTTALANIVARALGIDPQRHPGRIHPATRTFLALRIAVNRELDNLRILLQKAPECLRPGGRIGIISFHSGEDRLVKAAFHQAHAEGLYEILTRKPITPTEQQIQQNPRCRSAKLRVAKRTDKPLGQQMPV